MRMAGEDNGAVGGGGAGRNGRGMEDGGRMNREGDRKDAAKGTNTSQQRGAKRDQKHATKWQR